MKRDRLSIVVDSNEAAHGRAWSFPGCNVSVRTLLKHGCDYTVHGFAGVIGVERKSVTDFYSSIGINWHKFRRALAKLKACRRRVIIVEGPITATSDYSTLTREAVLHKTSLLYIAGFPVLFADSKHVAEAACLEWLRAAVIAERRRTECSASRPILPSR